MILDLLIALAGLMILWQIAAFFLKDLPWRRQHQAHARSVARHNAQIDAWERQGGQGDPPDLAAIAPAPDGAAIWRENARLFVLIVIVAFCLWKLPAWLPRLDPPPATSPDVELLEPAATKEVIR